MLAARLTPALVGLRGACGSGAVPLSALRPLLAAAAGLPESSSGSATRAGAPAVATTGPVRTLMTKRRRKELRKDAAADMRELLAFARSFDPVRTCKLQIKQTLEMLAYDFRMNETVAEGLTLDFTLVDWYCGFEVVEGAHYVLPTAANASDDVGMGPGVRPAVNQPGSAASGKLTLPHQSGWSSLPPEWLSPVRGLVLDKETAARHAAIRAKGWKLVVVPQPLWEFAATKPSDAHYARRDLLLSALMPLVPFEARATASSAGGEAAAAASTKAKERSAKLSERELAEAAVKRAALSARGAADVAEERQKAEEESASGRSRKARRIAKFKVTAAANAADEAAAAAAASRKA